MHGDPTVGSEVQLIAHQFDARLATELEDDASDVEAPTFPGLDVRDVDPMEPVGPDEGCQGPSSHLDDPILRADPFDQVPSGRELGRAVYKGHRRPRLSELEGVEHGAVPASEHRHRPTDEMGQIGLDQVGHVPTE